MEDLKKFLINEVLLFKSDTPAPETEKRLQEIRREKNKQTDYIPVIRNSQYDCRFRKDFAGCQGFFAG